MKNKIFLNIIVLLFISSSLFSQTVDRTKPPQLPELPKLNLPKAEKFELSNGLKVTFIEKHEVPLVQLNIMLNVGSVNEKIEKAGISSFMMDMLMEGAAGKTSLELSDEIDFLGANISTGSSYHTSEITLHTPLAKFDEALKLLADITLKPDFPESEFKRLKNYYLGLLTQAFDRPTSIAYFGFAQILYGKNHPYGRSSIGDESTIKNFSQKDLKDYYSEFFKSNNACIVVVGYIKKDELKKKLEMNFGKWESGKIQESKYEKPAQVEKRKIYIIDKPEAPQSVIYIGKVGEPRSTEDYSAITVMNTVLGGLFTSRLNNNLREEHGYTYGARSYFAFRKEAGPFIASSSVQTEVTDSALYQFFVELKGISEPVSENDLLRGKNYVALTYPSEFQNVANIASQIGEMIQYNLPDNYFNEFIGSILNVSAKDFEKAAKKYIVPEKMIVVVVGDKTKIEEPLKKLNLGEVEVLSIKDVLGEKPTMLE